MRRGEVAGLARKALDLVRGRLSVQWQLGRLDNQPTFKPRPKSRAGRRTLALDPTTVAALTARREQQQPERATVEELWQPVQTDHLRISRSGLVFTWENGRLIHPKRLTTWFKRHCQQLGFRSSACTIMPRSAICRLGCEAAGQGR